VAHETQDEPVAATERAWVRATESAEGGTREFPDHDIDVVIPIPDTSRTAALQVAYHLGVKYREGFRPFAPSVLEEDIQQHFELDRPSPYMLLVAPVRAEKRIPFPDGYDSKSLHDRLYFLRSDLPSITHIDYSARVQSVNREVNPRYWQLIQEFKKLTGYGVIVNTSFNVRGEPMVCTPADAYRCFMRTEMDYLVMGNYVLDKREQPKLSDDANWMKEFKLD
jgi:carbamoyltransferase